MGTKQDGITGIEKISFWKKGKLVTKKIVCNSLLASKDVERYAMEHDIKEYFWAGVYCLMV